MGKSNSIRAFLIDNHVDGALPVDIDVNQRNGNTYISVGRNGRQIMTLMVETDILKDSLSEAVLHQEREREV